MNLQDRAELDGLTKRIAAALTAAGIGEWHANPRENGWRLAYITNGEVTLSVGPSWDKKGRLEIAAQHRDGLPERTNIPRDLFYGRPTPTITVNPERSPEAIAKDIIRRLLPDAHTWRETNQVKWQEECERVAKRAEVSNRLAAALGTKPDDDGDVRVPTSLPTWGRLKVSHTGSHVTIELNSCPPDLAEAIAVTVTGWAVGLEAAEAAAEVGA